MGDHILFPCLGACYMGVFMLRKSIGLSVTD